MKNNNANTKRMFFVSKKSLICISSIPFPVQNGNSSVQNGKNYHKYKYKKYFINHFSHKIVNIL